MPTLLAPAHIVGFAGIYAFIFQQPIILAYASLLETSLEFGSGKIERRNGK